MDFTISKADDGITEILDKEDGIMMYSVTGAAISLNDVVKVTVDADLQAYSPVISYEYCSMQGSLDNSTQIDADAAVFTNEDGKAGYWLVRITLNLNGQTAKKLIRICVKNPEGNATSTAE